MIFRFTTNVLVFISKFNDTVSSEIKNVRVVMLVTMYVQILFNTDVIVFICIKCHNVTSH
jgi:hypothetical protein